MVIPRGVARRSFPTQRSDEWRQPEFTCQGFFSTHTCTRSVHRVLTPSSSNILSLTPHSYKNLARDRVLHSLPMSPSVASQQKDPRLCWLRRRLPRFGSVPGPSVSVTLVCPLCLWIPAAPIGPHCPQQNAFLAVGSWRDRWESEVKAQIVFQANK